MTDKLKPFDLTAALAGAPVVTRDGRKVLQIAHFPSVKYYQLFVLAEAEFSVNALTENGEIREGHQHSLDLFMAPVKRTVWVNMYRSNQAFYGNDLYGAGLIFNSKHDAEETAKGDKGYIGTYPLEIEE